MSPEMLYKICYTYALRFAHDQMSAEAAANGATAAILIKDNQPTDQQPARWRHWAKYYTLDSYRRENCLRDNRIAATETDIESPHREKEPTEGFMDMLNTESSLRPIEAIVEGRAMKADFLHLLTNSMPPMQGHILLMLADGLTVQEIAELIGKDAEYVYRQRTAGRKRLRKNNPELAQTRNTYYQRHPSAGRADYTLERRIRNGESTLNGKRSAKL